MDPFNGEGQFINKGYSYTLAVYWTKDEDQYLAKQKLAAIEADTGLKTFVSIGPLRTFYDAEEYHQYYYKKNPIAFDEEMRNSGRKH